MNLLEGLQERLVLSPTLNEREGVAMAPFRSSREGVGLATSCNCGNSVR